MELTPRWIPAVCLESSHFSGSKPTPCISLLQDTPRLWGEKLSSKAQQGNASPVLSGTHTCASWQQPSCSFQQANQRLTSSIISGSGWATHPLLEASPFSSHRMRAFQPDLLNEPFSRCVRATTLLPLCVCLTHLAREVLLLSHLFLLACLVFLTKS